MTDGRGPAPEPFRASVPGSPRRLDGVVPWGRAFEEYEEMFALTAGDLEGRILDCGGGPSAFGATLASRGGRVVALDPIYEHDADALRERFLAAAPVVLAATEANRDAFVWRRIRDLRHLRALRFGALETFLADLAAGRAAGRYRTGRLPSLPFRDREFDLALCSHLLFTYSHELSLDFHLASLRELLRVAAEVRVFPLLVQMTGERSPWLEPALAALRGDGVRADVVRVAYEFQRGGNELLRLRAGGGPASAVAVGGR